MIARLIPVCLALLVFSGAVAAQGKRLDLPPAPKPKPVQETPADGEQDPVKPEGVGEATDGKLPALWAEASGPFEELFLRFEMDNNSGRKAVRKRYLEELRGLGLGSQLTAVKALQSQHPPTVILAAEILEWVGGIEDVANLVAAASSVNDVEAVGVCLDTALRLANGVLPVEAVRLLGHPKRQMRTVAEARLSQHPNPAHLSKLLQFLNFGRDNDVRLRAARLLAAFPEDADARAGLRQALRGDSMDVAMLAVRSLAGDGNQATLNWLQDEFLVASTEIEAAYLLMGVLLHQNERTELLLRVDLQDRLRELLHAEDPFVSGVAASALAEYVFRADLQGDISELERGVPLVLVRAVGGVEFYPQYARFAPLAERSLRRITGMHYEDQAGSAWVDWLAQNHQGFHFVRGQIDVNEGEISHLRVMWTTENGIKRTLVGIDAVRVRGDRVVGAQGSAKLLQLVQKPGLLSASMMPGMMGLAEAPLVLAIDISIESRRKTLSFRGSAGEPWVGELLRSLEDLYETTGWQALAGSDFAGRELLKANLERFDSNTFESSDQRTAALIDLSSGRMAGLEESVLRSWVTELGAISNRSDYWTPDLSREFLGLIPLYAQDQKFVAELLSMVLSDRTHSVDSAVIDLLAELQEPSRSDLLLDTMLAIGADSCGVQLQDDRLAVRLAAVRALPQFDNLGVSHLITALDDVHPLIQRTAIRGLGNLRASVARDLVTPFIKEGMPVELRRESIRTLGQIGSASSVPSLVAIANAEDIGLQLAAVAAIAEIPGQEAGLALGQLFPFFAGTPVEGSFMRSLMSRGSGAARLVLRPYLMGEDVHLSQRAAVLGGSLGDPIAAPVLMDWLPRDPRNPELLGALATSLCVDFRTTPDPAGTYQAWWVENQSRTSADWLRNAAAGSGLDIPRGFDDPTKVAPKKTVEALLTVLETGPAHMRAVTCYFLNTLTGIDAAVIAIGTPHSEVLRRAQPWHDWLGS